jgi:hypothetical protein
MLLARKLKIIGRFEKKLLRFEGIVKKHHGPGQPNQRISNLDDEFFDLNNSQDDKDLLEDLDI